MCIYKKYIEIKSSYYQNNKLNIESENFGYFISRYIYRPLSLFLTIPFAVLNISPNTVTWLSLSVGVIGIMLLLCGTKSLMLTGSLLIFFAGILDYIDGNLARLYKLNNYYGKFIDGFVDTIIIAFIPIALGFGSYNAEDKILIYFSDSNKLKIVLIFLSSYTTYIILLNQYLYYRYHFTLLDAMKHNRKPQNINIKINNQNSVVRLLFKKIINFIKSCLLFESFFMMFGIVLFVLLDVPSLYIIIRLVSSTVQFIIDSYYIFRDAPRILNIKRSY